MAKSSVLPSPSILPSPRPAGARKAPPGLDRLTRTCVHIFLQRLRQGRLTVVAGQERRVYGQETDLVPGEATLVVQQPAFYGALLAGGSRGLGEAYIRGYWSSPDLTAALCLLLRAYQAWEPLARGLTPLLWRPRRRHGRNRNTPTGSRRNIAAHYDLGNEFYALFLDPSMAYSCAVFPRPDSTLEEAQQYKNDLICRKLNLGPDQHLLEIGTGWGGLALHAARQYGCRVTTTTISQRQYDYAGRAVQQAGLGDKVTVLNQDYRQLAGKYDRLAAIEMIEAVGHDYLPEFFRVCNRCLKPDGLMLLQAITINDRAYHRYLRTVDFIRSHIFPGGALVSVQALGQAAARTSDLRLVNLEDLTPFYVRTLHTWRERFLAHLAEVRAQGFGEEFIRLWEFYFSYCEAGFQERYTGDVQLLYAKPGQRGPVWPWVGKGSTGELRG